ncbi:MAG: gliding motility-associated C-terminal domain-containing protein [Bacteroidota bacterium]
MLRVLSIALFSILLFNGAKAQDGLAIAIDPENGNFGNGEDFCVDVIVDDFTDFFFVNFTITWNPDVIQFDQVIPRDEDMHLGLTGSDFLTADVENGILTFNWEDETENGVTIPTRNLEEKYRIFSICFTTSPDCGGKTKIDINESSETILRAGVGNGSNIGFTVDEVFDAEITVAGTPVTISATKEVKNPGEMVCISYTAEDFVDVLGAQFSIAWDTDVLAFQSVQDINLDFPFLSLSSFFTGNASSDGVITFSWFNNGANAVTVAPNTPMFDLCFEVVGEGGSSSEVIFSSEPAIIEIVTGAEGDDACKLLKDGEVLVKEQEGEVSIQANGGGVQPGDTICLDFVVDDFFAVTEMNFSLNWDADVLEFISVENLNLDELNTNDFFLGNTGTGFLTFTWDDFTGVLEQDGTRIFSLCFRAIGPVGTSTPVSFVGDPQPIFVSTTSNGNAGLNTSDGTVTILPPESLNLNVSNATVSPDESFCIDVTAENFNEIVELKYSMGWETKLLEFDRVDNFGIPGLDASNFDVSNAAAGFLSVDWTSNDAAGETLPDDVILYSICFNAKEDAKLGDCDAVFFSDIPDPIRAITANSGGNSIVVTDLGNDVCIFDPGGLTVEANDALNVAPDSTVCIPFVVRRFADFSEVKFSINWNPSLFEFVEVRPTGDLPGLAAGNFTTNLSSLGIMGMTWQSPDGNGVDLEDETAIFELCLKAVGQRLSCSNMEITSSPVPFEVKSPATEDENLSLNPLNGQLCIADALELELASTTPSSCSTSEDGSIRIVVNGGAEDSYTYFWTNEAGDQAGITSSINSLAAGTYLFTVTDENGLTLTDTVTLESRNPAPIANAGPDRNLSCGETNVLLQIVGSSVGDNISYKWEVIEGRGSTIAQNFLANEAGEYLLMVTNDSTGCSATDTVMVTLSDQPNVDAGEDRTLTCAEETIQLDGSNSDQGDNVSYEWFSLDGGLVAEGETTLNPTIETPGTYILRLVKDGTDGNECIARDTVVVDDARINVVADAGPDRILNCSGDPVILGGSRSSTGDNFTAQWTGEGGGLVAGTENQLDAQASSPGIYILTITDQVSACSAVDTVTINPDEQLPIPEQGFIDQLDCNTTEVALNIQVGNTAGSDVSVIWFKDGIRLDAPNDTLFTPMVSEPGVYEVLVTNVSSGCTSTLPNVVVTENTDEPTANVSGETVLGCEATASVILNASGSSEGTDFIYNWSGAEEALIRPNGAEAEAFDPGTYYLEVTNISNGCTAIDSITITATQDRPTVMIARPIPIPCTGGTTELDGSGSSEGTYSWVRLEEGGIILNADESIATVEEPGLYGLRITDAAGCTAFDSVMVTQSDTSSIQVEIDYSSRDLTCTVDAATITINAFPADGNYTYNWIADNGQNVPDPAAAINDISEAGLITVEVTETNLNCTRTALVILNRDEELSEISLVDDTDALTLDCGSGVVMLDASATSPTAEETFVWKDPSGNIINGAGLTPEVGESGIYTFILSNTENGCSDSLAVEVSNASDLVAMIEEAEDISCRDTLVLLRGFNSSNGQNIEYEWTSVEGNEVRPLEGAAAFITMPGTYNLLVRNTETMCEATTSITVGSNLETPTVNAGQDEDLGCNTSTMIGDINPVVGDSISYIWTLDGQELSESTAQITANSAGTYVLTVLNTINGCSASDEVVITQNFQLEIADAGSGETTCDVDSLMLMANLPEGAQGVWTTSSPDARIADANSPETLIGRLDRGDNLFIWTLSTAECPSYSADTVIIAVESLPIANNDKAKLGEKEDSVGIKVIANDDLFNVMNWNAEIIDKPSIGTITSFQNGVATFTAAGFTKATDEFTYEVCSITCPDLCSSATVTVEIEPKEPRDFDLPNVITANGDGQNDFLEFDVLLGGNNFPDNQISIFNRWGDVVYEAKPYNNDWGGIGLDGRELPQGTYYYILRLDVAEGLIIRGDITIMK